MQPGSILRIALVFVVIALFPAHDAAGCCKIADIQLTVDCAITPGIIQWQWHAHQQSAFGFCVYYSCRQPTDGDYCNNSTDNDQAEVPQKCFYKYDKSQSYNLTVEDLKPEITNGERCWFWMKDVGIFGIDDNGCSEVVHCNFSSTPASSSSEASSNIVSLVETSSSNFNPTSLMSLSATTLIASATSATSMNSPLFMSPSSLSVTEQSQPASITTTHRSVELTAEISPTVTPLFGSTAQITAQHKISFFVTFSCIIAFITLLLTITLFLYWNKRVQKKFEASMKTRMEKECCLDIYDIAKESESEIENVKDHGCEDDLVSITEDDLYMYNKILYPWHIKQAEILQQTPLVLSQLSILTNSDIEDGSVISLQLSNDYYRTNSGSAGRCSQSNPASSQQSHTSNTPVSSNDDITDIT